MRPSGPQGAAFSCDPPPRALPGSRPQPLLDDLKVRSAGAPPERMGRMGHMGI